MTHKKLYMHTIDGKPAQYMSAAYIKDIYPAPRIVRLFAESLEQIKQEQRASHAIADEHDWPRANLGHVLLKIPAIGEGDE
jgi:hypothetical protein